MTFTGIFVRSLLANATAGEWMDAVVTGRSADGSLVLTTLDDSAPVAVATDVDVALGEPVAVHRRYGLLAVGGAHHDARVAA